ncbi:putative serine:pyruvate/alanine:glyoxylate aminotransferase [Toxoplasma gondii TgCatPRC2]|uniref:Serine:pyruvate/alanine:glyoxylate aminotransferase n=3 Tax=Toxoplasma gondii TaxID=5811 RepID=A0A125YV78_TOXGV|nr:hypothetical protein TGME49_239520 [Toxoplasma gondii ME49]EPT30782.1 hypothetical protein TGME49_239520 [Toxoplasma gondii ME49]ESS31373.1 putative serine:pyruvate/alanine:glyoxylate aminotransferase [Toxoplasma gondii VEG]KYK66185.1 putative serine:pyruvate/alanine:glyoxylate aminotransferase [Toxoplasma gondii TgCatPRC2]|eukprot:XP_018637659.1 hypothetical protein TGME49_239520 [Toxoplasma gondii ME49]
MAKQEKAQARSQRVPVPRGFRTNELYYMEEDTQRRIHHLMQQKKEGSVGSRQPPKGPRALQRLTLRTFTSGPQLAKKPIPENIRHRVQISLCDAALTPPLPQALIRDPKVAAYLKYFSSYGICPLESALQSYGPVQGFSPSVSKSSSRTAPSSGFPGSTRSAPSLCTPTESGSSAQSPDTSRRAGGQVARSISNSTSLSVSSRSGTLRINGGGEHEERRQASSAVAPGRSKKETVEQSCLYPPRAGPERETDKDATTPNLVRASSVNSSVRKSAEVRGFRGLAPTSTDTGERARISSWSHQQSADVNLSVAGITMTVTPVTVSRTGRESMAAKSQGFACNVLPRKDLDWGCGALRKVKGSELMKGRFVVEKQISETETRKVVLLKDLTSKTAALKQTNKKLGQRKTVESKLQHIEQVLEETFATIQKPLLAASEFPEFASSSESQKSHYLKKKTLVFGSSCATQTEVESDSTRKTRYVVVVDLAMDMEVYLPDVREELTKLMQETMLKQHSVLNIVKLGNKVEACFPTMPTRVDERTVTIVDRFINSLAKSQRKGGGTDLVEGLREALLMKPDVLYLISHTPPSTVRHQAACVKMVQEYFQNLKDKRLAAGVIGYQPPAEFRYFAFRNPLAQSLYEQFFRQLCAVSTNYDDPENVAERNCVLADREALWRSVLRDTKKAKQLRAKLKKVNSSIEYWLVLY